MIAILSDFGNSEYVGIMKGVIHSINQNAQTIDISHSIEPQNIMQGAWILLQSYKNFPKNTTFLAVVDPGVGSKRKAVAIETRNYFFVGPDNGLLYAAAKQDGIIEIIELGIPKSASKTFHGRDVFAKAAAQIEKGTKLKSLGKKTNDLKELSLSPENNCGTIMHIDSFGNGITNLKPAEKKEYTIKLKNKQMRIPFYETYDAAREDILFLVTGSSNTLEFSVKNKHASRQFNLQIGDSVEIN